MWPHRRSNSGYSIRSHGSQVLGETRNLQPSSGFSGQTEIGGRPDRAFTCMERPGGYGWESLPASVDLTSRALDHPSQRLLQWPDRSYSGNSLLGGHEEAQFAQMSRDNLRPAVEPPTHARPAVDTQTYLRPAVATPSYPRPMVTPSYPRPAVDTPSNPRPAVDLPVRLSHIPKLRTVGQGSREVGFKSRPPALPARERLAPRPQAPASDVKTVPIFPARPRYYQRATPPTNILSLGVRHRSINTGTTSDPFCGDTANYQAPDSPPPPPPHVAQNDLMTRLGLLLGDRIHPSGITGVGVTLHDEQQREDGFSCLSSVSSSDRTPETGLADTSPMSTLTVSSGGETPSSWKHGRPTCQKSRVPTRDASVDSLSSLTSSSISNLPTRPHSFNTSMPGDVEILPLFEKKRNLCLRRSVQAGNDGKVKFAQVKPSQLQLKPLIFEVAHPEGKPVFVGRSWLFKELETVLCENQGAAKAKGAVIVGDVGTGKTTIIEELVNHSSFSNTGCELFSRRQQQDLSSPITKDSDRSALHNLGDRVVAYHLCQADNNITCMVPDMVASMAAQMARSPQLLAYRDLLLQEPQLQNVLSRSECFQNPSLAFLKGILEPLRMLKNAGKIVSDCCIFLVDSLNEAEFHKPEYGDTIASFLCRHASKFPDWLKLVVSVQTPFQDLTSSLKFPSISLNCSGEWVENISRDIISYIGHRISINSQLKANISLNNSLDAQIETRFASHVQSLSSGCFLYIKLVLDLIERGLVVPKSSNCKILPVNLSEVFLLHFNLKFSSVKAFERVSTVLEICLAALYPLTCEDIYLTVNSSYTKHYLPWAEFSQHMSLLTGFLHCRHDNTYIFFHPAFREWLIHRQESDSLKFLCDVRTGHALLAFRLSRRSTPLSPEETLELGHHMLKAHIYKNVSRRLGYSSRDMQAHWLGLSSKSLDAALVSHRNIYSPNIKVSRLILLAGGNPNTRTDFQNNAPILSVIAREGFADMVALLLEFGADPNLASDTGMTALGFAAAAGHTEVLRMLYLAKARVSAQDNQGQCVVIHAVIHGQLESLVFLLQQPWPWVPGEPSKGDAVTQSFVAAAAAGHTQILAYLHRAYSGSQLNLVDTLLYETALTTACSNGRKEAVSFLLEVGADVTVQNRESSTPLLCAAKSGRWEICGLLLDKGIDLEYSDRHGRTALIVAAGEGHVGVLNLLLNRGASQSATDRDGLTAFCWACLAGHILAVEVLVKRGSNVNHTDCQGHSALHLTACTGNANIAQFLLDKGADIECTDHNGRRPLDCAISCHNTDTIVCFLRKGAKLGSNTWTLAAGRTDVLLLLLNKLMEDGNILYKKNRIKEASQRYQYALKKFPSENGSAEAQTFQDLRLHFLLSLSRCRRRMNDWASAVDLATRALELRPRCFEALYARARARRDGRQYAAAQQDLMEALQLAPNNRELQRLLTHINEECRELMSHYQGEAAMAGTKWDLSSWDDEESLSIDQCIANETSL